MRPDLSRRLRSDKRAPVRHLSLRYKISKTLTVRQDDLPLTHSTGVARSRPRRDLQSAKPQSVLTASGRLEGTEG
jgi:hypothetical protein